MNEMYPLEYYCILLPLEPMNGSTAALADGNWISLELRESLTGGLRRAGNLPTRKPK